MDEKYHRENTLQQKQSRQELHNKCTPQDNEQEVHMKRKETTAQESA